MEYVNVFTTKDFHSACSLRTVGFELLNIEFNSQGIATFVFSDPDNKASKTVANFWDKKLTADLRSFTEAINEFKSRIINRH